MSGGKAYRHGYYGTLPHTTPQRAAPRIDFDGIVVVIIASLVIVLVTAVATDRSLLTSVDQSLRSLFWDLGLLFRR